MLHIPKKRLRDRSNDSSLIRDLPVQTCKYWSAGTCRYNDDQCYYLHSHQCEVIPAPASAAPASANASQSDTRSHSPREEQYSNQSQSTAATYQVVPPSEHFYLRTPYSPDVSRTRLSNIIGHTNFVLRRRNGVAVTGYPRELEEAYRQIHSGIETFSGLKGGVILSQCNLDGKYQLGNPGDYTPNVMGCYSISTFFSVALTKTGSGSGADGVPGRFKKQTNNADPKKFGAIFSDVNDTMEWLRSNEEAMNLVKAIRACLTWAESYIPIPDEYIVNHLDECAFVANLPGDSGGVVGEQLLNMGSSDVHRIVRSPSVDPDNVANELVDTEQIVPFFTWSREITSANYQVRRGETSTGRRMTQQTQQMVKDMVYFDETFMQEFMVCERLLDGISETVTVHDFVDAVSLNPIGDALAELAKITRAALGSDVDEDTIHDMLRNGLEQWYQDGEKFFDMEQRVAGNLRLLAKRTKDVLTALVKDLILSGKKTLILAENAHYDALEAHQKDAFEALFGAKKHVGSIYCANGREAGRLYRVNPKKEVRILVMGSMFVMNAPDKSFELRLDMCAEFLAIKWTLVQANLMSESALLKSLEELVAFSIQLRHPFSHPKDTSLEMWAIKNNSPANYHFGHTGKKGLQALINILADWLEIKGIHAEAMASFAMHLGAKSLRRLFAMLGHDIDCSNMAATLMRLRSEQKYRGGVKDLSDVQRQAISSAQIGRKIDTSKYQATQAARRRQFENLSPSQKRSTGIGIFWYSKTAVWRLQLPRRIFGKEIYIGSYTYLRDAKAAQKDLLEAMKGLRARKPNSNYFDINNRRNKAILDKAIKQARLTCNADENKKSLRDINIL